MKKIILFGIFLILTPIVMASINQGGSPQGINQHQVLQGEKDTTEGRFRMGWPVAWGLASFAVIYGLLKVASMFMKDEADDVISASLKSAMKLLFIGASVWMMVITVGNINHVTSAWVASDSLSDDVPEIDTFLTGADVQYNLIVRLATWLFIPFFTLFIIYMFFRNIKSNIGGEDG